MRCMESFLLSVCKMSTRFATHLNIEASTEEDGGLQVKTNRAAKYISIASSKTSICLSLLTYHQIEMLFDLESNDKNDQNLFSLISCLMDEFIVPHLKAGDHTILATKEVYTVDEIEDQVRMNVMNMK
jgi:hypothetical protein